MKFRSIKVPCEDKTEHKRITEAKKQIEICMFTNNGR